MADTTPLDELSPEELEAALHVDETDEDDDDNVEIKTRGLKSKRDRRVTGWCMTNHHEQCHFPERCECDCTNHGTDYVADVAPSVSPRLLEIMQKYYPGEF